MNKEDYREIADIIKKHIGDVEGEVEELTNELADYFENREPEDKLDRIYQMNFNREQFLKDCGVE